MPDTKITGGKLKNHWQYAKWKYVIMVIAMAFGWNLIYSVTAPRTPPELKVDIYMVGPAASSDALDALTARAKPDFPDMQELNFINIPLSGDSDVYAYQRYQTMVGAGEGDVYIVDGGMFESLVDMGGAVALNPYIESGALVLGDLELGGTTLEAPVESEDAPPIGRRVYGVPMDSLFGFLTDSGFDNRNKVMIVMSFSKNKENAVKMVNWLYANMKADAPEGLEAYDEYMRQQAQGNQGLVETFTPSPEATPAPSADVAP